MQIKKILVCITIVCILIAISGLSYAADKGIITGETVKLREEGNTDAKLVMLLSINDEVEVLKKEGDWYQVAYEGKEGFVHQDYIKVEGQKEDTNSQAEGANTTTQKEPSENTTTNTMDLVGENTDLKNTEEEEKVEKKVGKKITKTELKVYLQPVIHASQLTNISEKVELKVENEMNGWSYVVAEQVQGWVRSDQLEDIKQEQPVPEKNESETKKDEEIPKEETKKQEEKTTNKKGYVNVDTLNVRKQTNTSSEVIANLSKNAEVTIIGEQDNWYKIKISGKEGFVGKTYISDKKVEVTNRSSSVRTPNEMTNEEKEDSSITTGAAVVNYAKQFLGYPYILGASGPSAFDCSGYTYYIYKHFGITLNRTSSGQRSNGRAVAKSDLQQGDLVLFTGHVGMYIGGNQFIHAANAGKGVTITSLSDSYYVRNYITARRVL